MAHSGSASSAYRQSVSLSRQIFTWCHVIKLSPTSQATPTATATRASDGRITPVRTATSAAAMAPPKSRASRRQRHPPPCDDADTHGDHDHGGGAERELTLQRVDPRRQLVQRREPERKHGLARVERQAEECERAALEDRDRLQRGQVAIRMLGPDRHHGGEDREADVGRLLNEERTRGRGAPLTQLQTPERIHRSEEHTSQLQSRFDLV